MIVFSVAGTEMIARVRPSSARPAGTPMRLSVDMAKCKLFDPETKRALF